MAEADTLCGPPVHRLTWEADSAHGEKHFGRQGAVHGTSDIRCSPISSFQKNPRSELEVFYEEKETSLSQAGHTRGGSVKS